MSLSWMYLQHSLAFQSPDTGLETHSVLINWRHSNLKKKVSCCQFLQILLKDFVSNRKIWAPFGLVCGKSALFFLKKMYVCCITRMRALVSAVGVLKTKYRNRLNNEVERRAVHVFSTTEKGFKKMCHCSH